MNKLQIGDRSYDMDFLIWWIETRINSLNIFKNTFPIEELKPFSKYEMENSKPVFLDSKAKEILNKYQLTIESNDFKRQIFKQLRTDIENI